MPIIIPTLACLALYYLGYRFYARFLSKHIFVLDDEQKTPAHTLQDGIDYVPTPSPIAFSHHFASITGLAPMLGPAVAVIWGWLPALLWVVFGSILIGCVHDFSALVVSLRAKGKSIGEVAEGILGTRAKLLFLAIIFFGVALAMGVFVFIIAKLFSTEMAVGIAGYPQAVTPSAGLIVVALVVGYGYYVHKKPMLPLASVAFVLSLILVGLGHSFPTMGVSASLWPTTPTWILALLAYAGIASVLPVWVLLQARDFVNSMLLYLGLGAAYIGVLIGGITFQAPALRTVVDGAPSMWPFVFVFVACGAASGFHGLVSSGTTSKQLDKESDAVKVGYGGMVAESLLGLLAVLATTTGFSSAGAWHEHYASWASANGLAAKLGAFIQGTAKFIEVLGVPLELGRSFIAVVVVSFALTTLDSATRLLRYNIEEIADAVGGYRVHRWLSSGLAVLVIAVFAFYRVDGKPMALALWALFGTTNQLLAGLTLLTVTAYLHQRGKPVLYTGLPAAFLLIGTFAAMFINLGRFEQPLLLVVGSGLVILGGWVVVEAVLSWLRPSKRSSMIVS